MLFVFPIIMLVYLMSAVNQEKYAKGLFFCNTYKLLQYILRHYY